MGRKKKKRKEEGVAKKKSDFGAFLKKRAPIYLGITALFLVFVVPSLTAKSLDDTFPELSGEEQGVVETLMGYNGDDGTGLTVMEAIEEKIDDAYPESGIFDDKRTTVILDITRTVGDDLPNDEAYRVVLDFESYKGQMKYNWNVDMASGSITSNNEKAKHIMELVEFYD